MEGFSIKDAVLTISSGVVTLFILSFKGYVVKSIADIFGPKDPVITSLNNSKIVRETIKQLLQEWGANRVYILQFHNGGHFYTGATMQKFSVTYEEQTSGIIPICTTKQNVPLTVNTYIKDIIEGNYKISDTEEVNDIISRTFYNEFHIKAAIGVPIFKDNKVIGAIILNYTDGTHQFEEHDLELLSVQCANLHTLLL